MKRCVLITGTGRSGTSLTAGLLQRAGVVMSEDLIEASAQNPLGSFEDRRIQELQRKMLSALGPLSVPPPRGWLKSPGVAEAANSLRDVVRRGVAAAKEATWGFKDPHSAFTMPLWIRIFNEEKITPIVYLCVRDPSAVVTSLVRQYDFDPAVAEVFWLTKNLRAILDTGADFFVVHYESLVSGNKKQLSDIIEHAQIGDPVPIDDIRSFIDPKLNRSGANQFKVSNPCVKKLWAALDECHGADFDRESLMRVAYEIEAEMEPWSGWANEVYRVYQGGQAARSEIKGMPTEQVGNKLKVAHAAQAEEFNQKQTALEELTVKYKKSLEIQSEKNKQARELFEEQHQKHLQTRETLEAKIAESAAAQAEAQETIAVTLRAFETLQEKAESAAEEIFRLRTFAQSLKRDEAKIRAEARKEIESLNQKLDARRYENDRQKDEIIALHGSTTHRVGRQLRALKRAPLRESMRLPSKIYRILRAQHSKHREGLR